MCTHNIKFEVHVLDSECMHAWVHLHYCNSVSVPCIGQVLSTKKGGFHTLCIRWEFCYHSIISTMHIANKVIDAFLKQPIHAGYR